MQPTPRLALNVLQFCEAYDISEGLYYKLKKQGLGPRETKIGTRTLISFKAADTWFAAREAASGKAATKPARSAKGENANL
ncbi:hypothetical protein JQ603_26770 [Bradyrhizobium liaoningense]|nr:hypothetical protein [Bradyrhizobium liaoningense]